MNAVLCIRQVAGISSVEVASIVGDDEPYEVGTKWCAFVFAGGFNLSICRLSFVDFLV